MTPQLSNDIAVVEQGKNDEGANLSISPKDTNMMNESGMNDLKHVESEVIVPAPYASMNVNVPPQMEQIRPINNLFVPVPELEQPEFEMKPMVQFPLCQEDSFLK